MMRGEALNICQKGEKLINMLFPDSPFKDFVNLVNTELGQASDTDNIGTVHSKLTQPLSGLLYHAIMTTSPENFAKRVTPIIEEWSPKPRIL